MRINWTRKAMKVICAFCGQTQPKNALVAEVTYDSDHRVEHYCFHCAQQN